MKTAGPKGHHCVDFCSPPQHCDLVHLNYESALPYTAHMLIQDSYWFHFRVAVISVLRAPELDDIEMEGELQKQPIMGDGIGCHVAYMIR